MNILVPWYLLCICFVFFVYQIQLIEAELFSQFTVFQVVFAVSWPIPYKNPLRKLFFNTGFQFNYGEPFALSTFYNPPYFQNAFTNRELPENADNSTYVKSDEIDASDGVSTEMSFSDEEATEVVETIEVIKADMADDAFDAANSPTKTKERPALKKGRPKGRSLGANELTGSDVTAGQLYESIEQSLVDTGYHKSCLLKSICELARHPLHKEADEEEHLVMEMINFMLTPTHHKGFASHESYEREKYEAAQSIGENGHDCDGIYPECENSMLHHFSYLDQ